MDFKFDSEAELLLSKLLDLLLKTAVFVLRWLRAELSGFCDTSRSAMGIFFIPIFMSTFYKSMALMRPKRTSLTIVAILRYLPAKVSTVSLNSSVTSL